MPCYMSPYPEVSKFLTKAPLGAAMQAHGSLPASTLLYAPPQFNCAHPVLLNPRLPKVPSLTLNCNAHGHKRPSFPATSIPALQYSRPLIQSTVACFGPRGVERMASVRVTNPWLLHPSHCTSPADNSTLALSQQD